MGSCFYALIVCIHLSAPAYDELSASKEDEDSDQVSSPPPPYTPSFCETGITKPQHTV